MVLSGLDGIGWTIWWQRRDTRPVAELLPGLERARGTDHPDTMDASANLARWTGEAGDPAAARDQYAALLPVRDRVLGSEHPDTLNARETLATWTGEAGDSAGARDQYAALLPVGERLACGESAAAPNFTRPAEPHAAPDPSAPLC